MVNLKCLRIAVAQFVKTLDVKDFLSDLPFQLDKFCWVDWRLKVASPQSDIYAYGSFISSQTHIEYLHLARPILQRKKLALNPPNATISHSGPTTLIGDPDTVYLFLPSLTGVRALAYVGRWDPIRLNKPFDSVPTSFSHLRVLTLYAIDLRNVELKEMAKYLRGLEILHVVKNGMGFDQSFFRTVCF
jgi:hypothetical protein